MYNTYIAIHRNQLHI